MSGRCEDTRKVEGRFLRCDSEPEHLGDHGFTFASGRRVEWPRESTPSGAAVAPPDRGAAPDGSLDYVPEAWVEQVTGRPPARLESRVVAVARITATLKEAESQGRGFANLPPALEAPASRARLLTAATNSVLDAIEEYGVLPTHANQETVYARLMALGAVVVSWVESFDIEEPEGGEQQ